MNAIAGAFLGIFIFLILAANAAFVAWSINKNANENECGNSTGPGTFDNGFF